MASPQPHAAPISSSCGSGASGNSSDWAGSPAGAGRARAASADAQPTGRISGIPGIHGNTIQKPHRVLPAVRGRSPKTQHGSGTWLSVDYLPCRKAGTKR